MIIHNLHAQPYGPDSESEFEQAHMLSPLNHAFCLTVINVLLHIEGSSASTVLLSSACYEHTHGRTQRTQHMPEHRVGRTDSCPGKHNMLMSRQVWSDGAQAEPGAARAHRTAHRPPPRHPVPRLNLRVDAVLVSRATNDVQSAGQGRGGAAGSGQLHVWHGGPLALPRVVRLHAGQTCADLVEAAHDVQPAAQDSRLSGTSVVLRTSDV